MWSLLHNFGAQRTEYADHGVDVSDGGQVVEDDRFVREQASGENGERCVLVAAWRKDAGEWMTSLNDQFRHVRILSVV